MICSSSSTTPAWDRPSGKGTIEVKISLARMPWVGAVIALALREFADNIATEQQGGTLEAIDAARPPEPVTPYEQGKGQSTHHQYIPGQYLRFDLHGADSTGKAHDGQRIEKVGADDIAQRNVVLTLFGSNEG